MVPQANRRSWLWMMLLVAAGAFLGLMVACHGGGYQPTPGEVLRIVAPTTMKVGSTQAASAQAPGANVLFRWSIRGGAFQGGNAFPATPQVAFTAVQAGTLTLSCSVVDTTGVVIVPTQSVAIKVTEGTSGGPAIQVPDYVTAGAGGYQASLNTPPASGATYTWSIDAGGTLTSPAQGASVTFAAGAGPILNLTCTETLAGASAATTEAVAVVAPPQTPTAITPSATLVTPGSTLFATVAAAPGMTYLWTISGGVFAGGVSPTTPVAAFTAGTVGTLTLTCAAVNVANTASTPTPPFPITVAAPASAAQPALGAPAWATAGAGGLAATITNYDATLTYAWTIGGGTFAGPTQTPGGQTVTFQAGPGPGGVALACTATGAAGVTSLPGIAGVAIAAAPGVPVIQVPGPVLAGVPQATAGVPQVAYVQGQPGETYQWAIGGGGAFNGPTQTPIGTGVSFTAPAAGSVQLYCTAMNSAGASSTPPAFAGVNILAAADQPVLAVTNPFAFAGAAGNTANVVGAQPGLTYTWTIQGGVITGAAQGPAITFTAGAGPVLTLTCTATTPAGSVSSPGSIGVAVGGGAIPPVINASANVAPNSRQLAWVQSQPNATYLWAVPAGLAVVGANNGPVLVYDTGVAGDLVLNCTVTVGTHALAATPFTQTVAAIGGAPALQTTTPWVTTGAQGNASVVGGAVAGMTYHWTISGGTFPGDALTAQGAAVNFTAGPVGANPTVSLACTATGAGGTPSSPGTLAVGIAALPPVPNIWVPPTFTAGMGPVRAWVVNAQADMTYQWTVVDGYFQGLPAGAGTEGTAVLLDGTLPGFRVLTCRAVNRAGLPSGEVNEATEGVPASAAPAVSNLVPYWTQDTGGLQVTAVPPAGTTLLWTILDGFGNAATVHGNTTIIDDTVPGFRMVLCQAVNAANALSTPPVVRVVDIVPPPAIQGFGLTDGGNRLYLGRPATVTATFTGGTGVLNGDYTVTSGQPFTITAVVDPPAYLLTVTNPAGTAVNLPLNLPVQDATTQVQFHPNQPQLPAVYDQPVTLNWVVTGTPTRLLLDRVGGDPAHWPMDVMGFTSLQINNPRGRETYRLQAVDPLGTTLATITTVARGLDLLAGDAVDFTSGFMSGPVTTTAAWRSVSGLAASPDGDLWFSEVMDSTLRKVSGDNGQVTVLAGLRGNPDTVQFPAVERFWVPEGMAVLPDGATILVADASTHTLKEVAENGAVTVYAGVHHTGGDVDSAPGVQGLLLHPTFLALHTSGFAFVTEPGSGRVRMVAPDGSIASLPYPDGLTDPLGVAVDPAGNVYVSDGGANELFRFSPSLPLSLASHWAVGRFAPHLAFNQPSGLSVGVNPADGLDYLFVADPGNHVVWRINLTTGAGAVIAGDLGQPGWVDGAAGEGRLRAPSNVVVAVDGSVYVADQDSTALRRIGPDGSLETLGKGNNQRLSAGNADGAGDGARFSAPQGLVVDTAGNTFVADTGNNSIRVITPQGVVTTFVAGLNAPGALARDAQDNLYVSETAEGRIRKITPQGVVTTLLEGNPVLVAPQGLVVGAAGNIFVTDGVSGDILELDADGNVQPVPVAAGVHATALVLDGRGHLLALDPGARGIHLFTEAPLGQPWPGEELFSWNPGAQDGVVAVGGGTAQFNNPTGLTIDEQGNLFLADQGNGLVRKVAEDGTVTTVAGTYPNLWGQWGVLPGILPGATAVYAVSSGDLVVTAGDAVFLITAP